MKKCPLKFKIKNYSQSQLIYLYKKLLKPRAIEEKMLVLLRQGKISKWFSGIGQEAIAVGATEAFEEKEYILPMHRNLGVFTTRNIPLYRLFAQFQGKLSGFTKGRDRSFHFGTKEYGIIGMISHLGAQLSVGNGIALAHILQEKQKVVLAFSGDGATSQGEFHEALNVASVWNLPIIFLIENNQYGLSTPNTEQFNCKHLTHRAIAYGMEAYQIEGNNILEMYERISTLRKSILKNRRPVLVEAMTFRMRGHEEASGIKYIPSKLLEEWTLKDPVKNYESFLLRERILALEQIETIKSNLKEEIDSNLEKAFKEPFPISSVQQEYKDIYASSVKEVIFPQNSFQKTKKRYIDAISDALRESMELYSNLILMGQDISEYGGVFKVTENFYKQFGKARVRNTPLCESAILGMALGLSIQGFKTIIEMQFADFVTCGFNQIINNLAKAYYRWNQSADVVIRMPTGAGVGAGPFHSQSNEAWFFHTPGLKVVYPSSPFDAKGLLIASIQDPNPILFFEHKALYRSISEEIPDKSYALPIGKAKKITEGKDLSIITYGMGVHWAKNAMENFKEYSADILDLHTLLPWDKKAVAESVKKTNKALICHEDCLTGGIGGEISAWISENCFEYLDAPLMREGSLDTPVPFSKNLEDNFLPKQRIIEKIKILIDY